MNDETTNALALARAKADDHRAHEIRATTTVDGDDDDAIITIHIPKKELERARPGAGQRRGVGFALEADVTIPDEGTFTLRTAWMTIKAR